MSIKEYYYCRNCGRAVSVYDPCDCCTSFDIPFEGRISVEDSMPDTEYTLKSFVGWLIQKGIIIDDQLIDEYLEEI